MLAKHAVSYSSSNHWLCCGCKQIASAVFIKPPLATCGLTEQQAQARLTGDIDIFVSKFKPMKNTLSGRDEKTFMKIIVKVDTDEVHFICCLEHWNSALLFDKQSCLAVWLLMAACRLLFVSAYLWTSLVCVCAYLWNACSRSIWWSKQSNALDAGQPTSLLVFQHAAVLTVLAHLQVIGCHMVGDDAPEIMQGIAIAMKCNATKAQFDATVGIHPTAAEELVTMRQRARRIQGSGTGRGHEHERMAGWCILAGHSFTCTW